MLAGIVRSVPRPPFDAARQDRLIEALERGESIAAACRFAPCSKDTIYAWRRAAQAGRATPEQAAFADRFNRATTTPTGRLSESDLLDLLERAARRGSVPAVKVLLEERRRKAEPVEPSVPSSSGSELIDALAARRRARPA